MQGPELARLVEYRITPGMSVAGANEILNSYGFVPGESGADRESQLYSVYTKGPFPVKFKVTAALTVADGVVVDREIKCEGIGP